MAFFEEQVISDSIETHAKPDKIFAFLTGIVDDDSYRAWHQKDHVCFKWLRGQPWAEESVLYAEEYLQGKLHKLKFEITRIVPNQRIEYQLLSRFVRKFFPKNEFIIQPKGESCLFIVSGAYRVGWIGKTLFKKAIDRGLSSVRTRMQEEGKNLKRIVEQG